MIYYVLPGIGLYGGVKKGFQSAQLLSEKGFECRVATPGGETPAWFSTTVQTVRREQLPEVCVADDVVLFSLPMDADFVASLKAERKVVHMQGANTQADADLIARHGEFQYISHGLHMTQQLLLQGVVAPYVPMGISDIFRHIDESKTSRSVALMQRKNHGVVDRIKCALPGDVQLMIIDGESESGVARILKSADVFLAISPNEAFGLPPLEAMCARCCVTGYPGDGGFEFMRHGDTAHLVANNDETQLLASLLNILERTEYRDFLRNNGRKFSDSYTLEREQEYLVRALALEPDF